MSIPSKLSELHVDECSTNGKGLVVSLPFLIMADECTLNMRRPWIFEVNLVRRPKPIHILGSSDVKTCSIVLLFWTTFTSQSPVFSEVVAITTHRGSCYDLCVGLEYLMLMRRNRLGSISNSKPLPIPRYSILFLSWTTFTSQSSVSGVTEVVIYGMSFTLWGLSFKLRNRRPHT